MRAGVVLLAMRFSFLMMALAVFSSAKPGFANDAQRETTVFVECIRADGKASTGSGVIVSETGHVLTARHVVPDGGTCSARLGSRLADAKPLEAIPVNADIPDQVDALFLRIRDPDRGTYPFARFCPVSQSLDRQLITALAFGKLSEDHPSASRGILANTGILPAGIVEVDLHLSRQRSGGPIFLDGQTAIIGIVSGVLLDTLLPMPDTYKMTAINAVAGLAGFLEQSPLCDALPPPVELTEAEFQSWQAIRPGNCDDLRRHLGRFPNGGYSGIAKALIASEIETTVEVWKPGLTRELTLLEYSYPPQATEAAARAQLRRDN